MDRKAIVVRLSFYEAYFDSKTFRWVSDSKSIQRLLNRSLKTVEQVGSDPGYIGFALRAAQERLPDIRIVSVQVPNSDANVDY